MYNVQIIPTQENKHIIKHHFPKTWIIKKIHQQTKIEHKNSHLPSLEELEFDQLHHIPHLQKGGRGSTNLKQEEQNSKVEQEK